MAGEKGKSVMNPKEKRNERNVERSGKEETLENWFKDPTPYKKDDIMTVDNPYEVEKKERNSRPGKPDGKEIK